MASSREGAVSVDRCTEDLVVPFSGHSNNNSNNEVFIKREPLVL